MSEKRSTPKIVPLDIAISAETVVDGIEMGVLANGIPYLTQNGLASACGVQRLRIKEISDEWTESIENGIFKKGKMTFISSYLREKGFDSPKLFIPFIKNGVEHHAFPDIVCMAILEFYAFESSKADNQIAIRSYRNLAIYGLREYIYKSVGYKPDDSWKYYHDRVSLMTNKDIVPEGYFIVFNEIAGMMIDLIKAGLAVNQYTVPDISVGLTWASHWKTHNFSKTLGETKDCSHYYPEGFDQAKSNPQKINAYPDAALPEFRRWFKQIYLPTKFPTYILKKSIYLPKGNEDATKLIETFKN